MTEEIRIDLSKAPPELTEQLKAQAQLAFKYNHTMPYTPEYETLMHELFPNLGEGSTVQTPVTVVLPNNVHIGKNVTVMPGSLMMSAGGITIDDDTLVAANVQLISNNHDLQNRPVITCKPVHICRNVWIGAGSTILPGVTIGENSVIGASSVVTKDIPPNTIAVGSPAKVIKSIDMNKK